MLPSKWLALLETFRAAAMDSPWVTFFQFNSVNVIYVTLGCIILGMTAGLIGSFAFLRKRSLLGDALSHAAWPGIGAAFMLQGAKDPWVILLGALLSCWLGAMVIEGLVRYTRCKEDSALGIVLSVFFGLGTLISTHIQHTGNADQAGLNKFFFGQAAALVKDDVMVLGCLGVFMCLGVLLAYKEFKIVSFDPDFAQATGLPTRWISLALATLIVFAVCIGLQVVGVVLMAAMLVTPAAAARYWTERLSVMLFLAALIGAFSGFLGAYISYLGPKMPTGPWMVVAVTTLFLLSFFLAPKRGVVPRLWRMALFRKKTARENVLRSLYKFGESIENWDAPHTLADLVQARRMALPLLRRTMAGLVQDGLLIETSQGLYQLSDTGLKRGARLTRLHRLWELYLTSKLEIAPDHVHDDAEEIEHILTPELERRLVEELDIPEIDPHGSHIPAGGAS